MNTSETSNSVENPEIEKLLKNVAEDEGFFCCEIEKCSEKEKGDGYLGTITGVRIVGKDRDNKDKILHLIVKGISTNDGLRADTELESIFSREYYMYDTVFPTFKKFEILLGQIPSNFAPKFYKGLEAYKSEALILENLTESGYKLYERRKPMNENHVSLVITQYGRLHALSFALRDGNLEQFKNMTGSMDDVYVKVMTKANFTKSVTDLSRKVQAALNADINKEVIKMYDAFIGTIESFISGLLQSVDNYSVILHGDCWTNNMMFKYENSDDLTKPTKVSFIDFQVSRLGPPMLDLAYFFYSCSSKEIISNFDYYLSLYYNSFSSHLIRLGCNPQKLFPYSALQQQWAHYARFGLIMSAIAIFVTVTEKHETVDFVEVVESGKSITDAFNYEIANMDAYVDRMKHIILHFVDNNFI